MARSVFSVLMHRNGKGFQKGFHYSNHNLPLLKGKSEIHNCAMAMMDGCADGGASGKGAGPAKSSFDLQSVSVNPSDLSKNHKHDSNAMFPDNDEQMAAARHTSNSHGSGVVNPVEETPPTKAISPNGPDTVNSVSENLCDQVSPIGPFEKAENGDSSTQSTSHPVKLGRSGYGVPGPLEQPGAGIPNTINAYSNTNGEGDEPHQFHPTMFNRFLFST